MHFYLLLVFVLTFLDVNCRYDRRFDLVNVCQIFKIKSIYTVPNSALVLHLTMPDGGLNCSFRITSVAPKLNFNITLLDFPYNVYHNKCWDTVVISDFIDYDQKNQTGTPRKLTTEMCRKSDLPKNGTITTTSPAVLTINSSCPERICDYYETDYKFHVIVRLNFDEGPLYIPEHLNRTAFTSEPNTTLEQISTTAKPIIPAFQSQPIPLGPKYATKKEITSISNLISGQYAFFVLLLISVWLIYYLVRRLWRNIHNSSIGPIDAIPGMEAIPLQVLPNPAVANVLD